MGRARFGMGTVNRLTPMNGTGTRTRLRRTAGLLILAVVSADAAVAQDLVLQLDPARSTIKFTLGAALHTVHGTFQVKTGALRANPASGKLSGKIVVDAKSGETGNGMRDRKMHKEVLESDRYPEITFRPERVDGAVAAQGKSSLKAHGIFSVHGSDREITIPADVDIDTNQWTANARFTIPYAKWGMKNPSTFFLHVSDEVGIEIAMAGTLTRETSTGPPAQ
jgi:polyisoprenoid-binding protein YceI